MWLERLLKRIEEHPGPVVIAGGEAYGAPFVIEALSKVHRVAWLQLSPADASDFVALGNRLAEAVNEALDANFLPHALPFTYSIEILKKRLPMLGPLLIACSKADYNPFFRDSLLSLQGGSTKVILDQNAEELREGALLLAQSDLALTLEEAEEIAGTRLTPQERLTLWRSSGGAYLTFLSSVQRLCGGPLPRVPSPRGSLLTSGAEVTVSPASLLEVLLKLGRYTEALDLAVMTLPERVAEVLKEAGPAYQEQGLLSRLYLLLESLDSDYQGSEEVLEWRLVAATSQNKHAALLPTVEAFLEKHEAPSLRARYAGALSDPTKRFAEAQRAAAGAATPLTLFQLGRTHPDFEKGIEVLQASVKLAESQGRPYDVARNAGALAENLMYIGRFEEAASWGEWALRFFDRHQLKDGQRRLRLLSNWTLARLLIGQIAGLREILKEAYDGLESAELTLATAFRMNLVNLEIVDGNISEAGRLITENMWRSPRWQLGRFAVPLVRTLLEKGENEQALEEGRRAVTLTRGEDALHSLPASLALGMALTIQNPKAAREPLTKVVNAKQIEANLRVSAALYLLKIGETRLSDLPPEVQSSLKSLSRSGLKLLSGPEQIFSGVWNSLLEEEAPLSIRVLGRKEVWLNGEPVELSGRALEVLVLLALNPNGLSPEALHDQLYGDESIKLVALRSAVSRLRNLIPISAYPQPYKITVPYRFDVSECEALLARGEVRGALELYRGPLLYESDAPGINEARLQLEERLRQAALHSGDPEALVPLAEVLSDDVELWRAAHQALIPGDPRTPLVRARLQRIAATYN